jgi:hypothetical protein
VARPWVIRPVVDRDNVPNGEPIRASSTSLFVSYSPTFREEVFSETQAA